jgi:hypothetical protein
MGSVRVILAAIGIIGLASPAFAFATMTASPNSGYTADGQHMWNIKKRARKCQDGGQCPVGYCAKDGGAQACHLKNCSKTNCHH